MAARGALARAIEVGRSRSSSQFTRFDGDLSQIASAARFGQSIKQGAISPTRLETWAACPFRYFLGYVLRLGALDTPEDVTTISSIDRGSLIHKILEDFMRQTIAGDLLPQPSQPWSDQDRFRLMQSAETAFADAESSGVTGKKLLWELVKQDIRDDLITFLAEDNKLRFDHGTGQLQVEASFGGSSGFAGGVGRSDSTEVPGVHRPRGRQRRRLLGPGHRLQDRAVPIL